MSPVTCSTCGETFTPTDLTGGASCPRADRHAIIVENQKRCKDSEDFHLGLPLNESRIAQIYQDALENKSNTPQGLRIEMPLATLDELMMGVKELKEKWKREREAHSEFCSNHALD